MSPPRIRVFSILSVFFVFYVIQPLLMTKMKNAGVPNKDIDFSWSTFVFMLPNYYAMIPVGFLPSTSSLADMKARQWRTGCCLSTLDLVNQLMSKVGLMMTGAGVYILINSSGIIWTVALSMFVLGKRPNLQQVFGIALVFAGLCTKVFDSAKAQSSDGPSNEFLGIAIVVLSSMLDGATFVLLEKFQKGPDAIPGPQLSCMQGTFASVALTIWTLSFTLSQTGWDQFIVAGVLKTCEGKGLECTNDNERSIIYCLYFLFMANVFTSSTVWWLLLNVGAVTFVVVKALKIVLVFSIAHVMYCTEEDKSECISPIRIICAALCVLGVVVYSLAPKPPKDNGEDDERETTLIVTDAVGLSFTSTSSVRKTMCFNASFHTETGISLPNQLMEMQISS